MAKLKPWYQVVTPREDLRENRALDASEFAVNLGHIHDRRAEVHKDYLEPDRFFSRTLLTQGLRDLATQVLRRMNGMTLETSAVFNMATQFGGGKTHSLTALYHIATGGQQAAKWKGIETLMSAAGVSSIPQAAVAVFNGKDFDSLTGRGGGNEPVRKTPWGDIAWQLGKAEALSVIAEHDREFIEPKGDAIRAFLPKDRPVVILMDELISYVSTYRARGYGDRLYNFIDCLAEVARGEKNVAVVVSVPASELEYTAADTADEARFKKMLDRVGKAILMSADKEMPEIIRRRLFEWEGLPEEGRKTAIAYADWAVEHSSELAGINRDTALEAFKSCYPFHPSVIALFEGKWQSVRQFQRTRGILKLLALWVSNNCQPSQWKHTAEPLITLGLAPFDNQFFRAALFEQLGDDKLEIPVTTDIWKKDGETHSARLDKEATDAIKTAQLHRKVAATIFFESSGGMSADHAEASLSEIKTDVCGPDVNTADVDTALEGLAGTCFYLQWERNRYRFGLSPNLNQVLVNRRGGVQPKPIEERIRQRTESIFRDDGKVPACKFIERELFPKRSNDVKEVPRITLVALSLEYPAQERDTLDLMEAIVRDCGSKGRTFKSALIFAVSDPADNIHDKAREVLAWEDIDDDEETKKRIDEGQLNLLKRNLKNAQRDLDEAIFRTYKHLYLLGKDNKLRHIDLGNITSSSAGCLVEVYLQRLGSGGLDEIVESVPARKLPNFWPASQAEWSTKAVRDAFYSSPLLPRLLNPEMIKRTIADGVSQRFVGYAIKDASGRLKLAMPTDSLFDTDVEISDDVYILKADEAQKLREPPRIAQVLVRPDQETVKTGDQIAYFCSGVDQYGQAIAVSEVQWTATGGTIDANGLFTAGDHGGVFTVTALSAGGEALAELRITTHDEPTPTLPSDPVARSDRFIRWRGNVPSQKWMNFYTKVLSKFANAQGLKIEVQFEVKVDQEHAESKAAETKTGLRELGLDDDVSAT